MLNTEDFFLIAGNPQKWDDEIRSRVKPSHEQPGCFESEALCAVQLHQHDRGRRSIRLHKTSSGWSVRYASGLNNFGLLFSGTKDHCIREGVSWVEEDPNNREFFAHKTDVPEVIQAREKYQST